MKMGNGTFIWPGRGGYFAAWALGRFNLSQYIAAVSVRHDRFESKANSGGPRWNVRFGSLADVATSSTVSALPPKVVVDRLNWDVR
jgi:hypothetical protein